MPLHTTPLCFNKGDHVEVLKTNPFTIWFPATVLRSTRCKETRNGQNYVEFHTISDEEPSGCRREYVNAGDVRPAPPPELRGYFKKNIPQVELNSRGVKLRIKCSRSWKETFSKGMSQEVKHDKKGCYGSWHTAAIVKSVGYDKFLVEYQKLKTVNGSQFLKEEVDASFIRPCPPEIRSFHPFEHLGRVDAWFNDGWWEGYITEVLGGLKYVVCLKTTEEELVFEHSMLRSRQEWIKEKWVTAREFDMTRSSSDMTLKSKELKIRIKCSGRTSEPKFSKGMRVEVKSDEEGY